MVAVAATAKASKTNREETHIVQMVTISDLYGCIATVVPQLDLTGVINPNLINVPEFIGRCTLINFGYLLMQFISIVKR